MKPVSKSEIQKMRALYEKTIHKTSTKRLKKKFPGRPGIQEGKSVWVSKKDLLQLLEHNEANGLRIYYGCHHESTHDDPQMDSLGLHNVILVATLDTVNPEEPTCKNSKDQLADKGTEDTFNKDILTNASSLYKGNGGDSLPTCPPTC